MTSLGAAWRRLLPAAALLALLAPSRPAPAQDRREAEAKREYRLGWSALQAGDYAEAYEHYKRSYELSPRPRTLFNLAVTEEKLGRFEDAMRHYAEFVAQAEPRDAEFKAQALERHAALERRLMGKLTVTSTPPGADVFVDDDAEPRGRTPVTLELLAGEHRVRLETPDAAPVERTVTVVAGQVTRAQLALEVTAPVVITTTPADAEIRRAGDDAPARGRYEQKLPPGRHRFTVSRDGYEQQSFTVVVTAGRVYERDVVLRPVDGGGVLVVSSNVAGATVSVDGVVVGTTTLDDAAGASRATLRFSATRGDHTVLVEARDGHRWGKRLHVSHDEIVTVDLEFRTVSRNRAAARWGLFGLGTVGLVAGGTLGVMALQDVTEPVDDHHDRGKRRALLADTLIIGGAAAILVAWKLRSEPETRAEIHRAH